MSEQQPGDHLSIRISNEDREKVAQILHNAMAEGRIDLKELEERLDTVYAAKTFADLEPVTRDLPVQAPRALAVPQSAPVSTNRLGGTSGPAQSIAIMSGVERKTPWVCPPHHNVVAVMGGVELDLSQATFVSEHTTIQCFAFWGGIQIRVPDDIHVQVDGFGFMGAFEDKTIGTPADGRPVVRITGFAMMAGVEVKPLRRKDRQRIEENRRREIEE